MVKQKMDLLVKVERKKRTANKRKLIDDKVLLPNPCSEMKFQNKCGTIHGPFRKKNLVTFILYLLFNK